MGNSLTSTKSRAITDGIGVKRWEAPPASSLTRSKRGGQRVSRYNALADQLLQRPGEWALVFEGTAGAATGLATHIRLGQIRCFTPSGDFDAVSSRVGGVTVVYARYVGDGGDDR